MRRLLAFEVERAADCSSRASPLVGSLRGRARLAVAGYVGGGRAALDAVEAAGYDVLGERAEGLAGCVRLAADRSTW